MKFQLASDLHLEFLDGKPIKFEMLVTPNPDVDCLLLAGDIGPPGRPSTTQFLDWCCKTWPYVVWVLGNHEYYSKTLTMAETEDLAKTYMVNHENLYVLVDNSVTLADFPHIRIVGTTLWTDIPDDKKESLVYYMNDFSSIPSFTVDTWIDTHTTARDFLQEQLADADTQQQTVLVVSHHLPTYELILPQYKSSSLNCGFASHCDDLLRHPALGAWVCGHSHGQAVYTVPLEEKKVQVHLNARGYPKEGSVSTYKPSYCFNL